MSGLIGSVSKTLRVQEFRTSGTYTVPAGVKTVELFMVGGGGGGQASGIGQGGNVVRTKYDVNGKASCAVVIGAGGAGWLGGGDTIFDSVVYARGGKSLAPSSMTTIQTGGMPGGVDGFGGHGCLSAAIAVAANGGGAAAAAAANTGGGGGGNTAGGSGYLRVEWYE